MCHFSRSERFLLRLFLPLFVFAFALLPPLLRLFCLTLPPAPGETTKRTSAFPTEQCQPPLQPRFPLGEHGCSLSLFSRVFASTETKHPGAQIRCNHKIEMKTIAHTLETSFLSIPLRRFALVRAPAELSASYSHFY